MLGTVCVVQKCSLSQMVVLLNPLSMYPTMHLMSLAIMSHSLAVGPFKCLQIYSTKCMRSLIVLFPAATSRCRNPTMNSHSLQVSLVGAGHVVVFAQAEGERERVPGVAL